MKVEQKGPITIIKDTQGNIQNFINKLTHEHTTFKNQNLIIDVTHDKNVEIKDIKLFSDLSKTHKKEKKSFVLVASAIDFNAIPTQLTVVPSIQEAQDIIVMEEIERDLGF